MLKSFRNQNKHKKQRDVESNSEQENIEIKRQKKNEPLPKDD